MTQGDAVKRQRRHGLGGSFADPACRRAAGLPGHLDVERHTAQAVDAAEDRRGAQQFGKLACHVAVFDQRLCPARVGRGASRDSSFQHGFNLGRIIPTLGDFRRLHQVALAGHQRHGVAGERGAFGQVVALHSRNSANAFRCLGGGGIGHISRRFDGQLFHVAQAVQVFVNRLHLAFQVIVFLGTFRIERFTALRRCIHQFSHAGRLGSARGLECRDLLGKGLFVHLLVSICRFDRDGRRADFRTNSFLA